MRNAATTVAAQNISSAIACKDFQGKETVKCQRGGGINEGSLDPSDNNQCHEKPPDGGS